MKLKINMLLTGLLFAGSVTMAQQGAPPQGQRPQGPPSPQQRLNHVSAKLDKELKLTADQKKKVLAAYQSFFADMEKLRRESPPPPPPPGKKEDIEKLAKQRDETIKKALSSEQFAKYQEVEKTMRPPRPQGPPGEQGPPPAKP